MTTTEAPECRICQAPATRDFRALGMGWLCRYCTRCDDEVLEDEAAP